MRRKLDKVNLFNITINVGNAVIIIASTAIAIIPVIMEVLGNDPVANRIRFWLLLGFLGALGANAYAISQKQAGLRDSVKRYLSTRTLLGGSLRRLTSLYTGQIAPNADIILQSILTVVVEETRQVLGVSEESHTPFPKISCSLLLLEEDGRTLRPVMYDRETTDRDTSRRLDVYHTPPLGGAPEAVKENRVAYIDDIYSDKYKHGFRPNRPYRSLLCFPLSHGDGKYRVGALDLDTPDETLFAEEETRHLIQHHIAPWIDLILLTLLIEDERRSQANLPKRIWYLKEQDSRTATG